MKREDKQIRAGFTLAEILAALTIGTMVLIVVLAIYSRAQTGAAGVIEKLESNRLQREVLQRISEDLDRIISNGKETQINIDNKYQDGYPVGRLEIIRTISNARNEQQTLERVVWQSNIEPQTGELTLYRSHSGIALEDNLLDQQKEPWQRELFVPVCTGLTFFRIEVPRGEEFLEKWSGENIPAAITITMSFGQPMKAPDGTFEVADEDKIIRTIAIDRTRKPTFKITILPDANQPNANSGNTGAAQPEPGALPPPPPPPMPSSR
jgi:type II secretory pathway pseudopilin PulG